MLYKIITSMVLFFIIFLFTHNVYALDNITSWEPIEEEIYIILPDGTRLRATDRSSFTLEEAEELGIDVWGVFERQFGVSNIDELNEDINALLEEQRQAEWERRERERRRLQLVRNIGAVLSFPLSCISRAWWKKRNYADRQKLEFIDWIFILTTFALSMIVIIIVSRILMPYDTSIIECNYL